MTLEIKIGRKVSGTYDIVVPTECAKTSREHLKIIFDNGILTIYDLETPNGTYVNGRRVAKCNISASDTVLLGSKEPNEAYKLDIKMLSEIFRKMEEAGKTDYSNEFKQVIKAYEDFNKEITNIRNKTQKKGQMPKIIVSIIIGLILLIVSVFEVLPPNFSKIQYPVMMIIMAIAGVVTFTGNSPDIRDKTTEIELKFQDKYICPKCKKPFNLNTHWKKIQKNKTCPHNCGANYE